MELYVDLLVYHYPYEHEEVLNLYYKMRRQVSYEYPETRTITRC